MKIFITGIAGAIGSNLAERFVSRGDEVEGLDAFTDFYDPGVKRRTAEALVSKGVAIREADLTTADLEALIPHDTDFVFHAAAQPGLAASLTFDTYLRNNIIATHRLFEALSAHNPRGLIFLSTSSVYGTRANGNEETAPRPTSHYGVTKLASEQEVLAAARDNGFPAVSLRLFSIYGERERPDKLFRKLIEAVDRGEPFPLYEGARDHRRSYTYVGDVLSACERVCERFDRCSGEIFNIGSDIVSTTGEGIDTVERLMGKKAVFKILPPRAGEQLETAADIRKARETLGYEPRVSLEEGLSREIAWYRSQVA